MAEVEARAGARPMHRVVVGTTELLTLNMRRIAFEGEAFATMSVPLPAQWLKVVFPASHEGARANRAYTIRHFHQERHRMEIDFVLHGDSGPASAWAATATVGDVVHLGSPRGGYRTDSDARWRLLAGNETALPAIASILESLPANGVPTCVVVEVPSMDDVLQQLRGSDTTVIHWIAREEGRRLPGCLLQERIFGLSLSDERGQVFLAGEATAVRRLNRTSLAGFRWRISMQKDIGSLGRRTTETRPDALHSERALLGRRVQSGRHCTRMCEAANLKIQRLSVPEHGAYHFEGT